MHKFMRKNKSSQNLKLRLDQINKTNMQAYIWMSILTNGENITQLNLLPNIVSDTIGTLVDKDGFMQILANKKLGAQMIVTIIIGNALLISIQLPMFQAISGTKPKVGQNSILAINSLPEEQTFISGQRNGSNTSNGIVPKDKQLVTIRTIHTIALSMLFKSILIFWEVTPNIIKDMIATHKVVKERFSFQIVQQEIGKLPRNVLLKMLTSLIMMKVDKLGFIIIGKMIMPGALTTMEIAGIALGK